MSTDGSVSEDVSTSTANAGKESGGEEDSIVSSEDSRNATLPREEEPGLVGDDGEKNLENLLRELRSGEAIDPDIWKRCDGRWVQLFQLVDKQYQDQILAQQEQYQNQIQLIQDEIKTLVRLQNRRNDGTKNDKRLANQEEKYEERTTTRLSSGYGTLTGQTQSPPGGDVKEEDSNVSSSLEDEGDERRKRNRSGGDQPLTSWAQRQKRSGKKAAKERARTADSSSFPRCDSLASQTTGLTYWRLNECELYRPLPDSLDSDAHAVLREATASLEPQVSLREIYQTKRRDCERSVTSSPVSSAHADRLPHSQLLAANARHSDRTSGFTSPSRFSSPSIPTDYVSDSSVVNNSNFWDDVDKLARFSSEQLARLRAASPGKDDGNRIYPTGGRARSSPSKEDPVVLSLLRQNLREKHERHMADLTAFYESEIRVLQGKLELKTTENLEKSNAELTARCERLEEALANSKSRVRELEAANVLLETKLTEWMERSTVTTRRLEESERSGREMDAMLDRLRLRLRQAEEEKEAVMCQLLAEYDSLVKETETVKNSLAVAESKLVGANDVIAELKRVIAKLESQVKQLEHENRGKHPHATSSAGLCQHPDLLLSPSRKKSEPDVLRRNSPHSAATPMMRALIELEGTRSTETRAPWVGRPAATVGLVERRHKELMKEAHRSSSLPPTAKSFPSSPKRCPSENYSTALGHPMPRQEHRVSDEGEASKRRLSCGRRKLEYPAERDSNDSPTRGGAGGKASSWDADTPPGLDDPLVTLTRNQSLSLAEAERFFDELTQEKQQIEAALSRIPGTRMTLQSRLEEVALENRLENLNRELGSIRMILKRFHVLRFSAHI